MNPFTQVGFILRRSALFPQAALWQDQIREGWDVYARQRKQHEQSLRKKALLDKPQIKNTTV